MECEWLVLCTHFQREEQIAVKLGQDGYQTYLPIATHTKAGRNGKLIERRAPLFICYLFVGVDFERQRWQELYSIPGVRSILGWAPNKAKPAVVSNDQMNTMKARLAEYGDAVPFGLSRPKFLQPETVVQLLWGSMKGDYAVVQKDMGARVEVLLWFANGKRVARLPREILAVPV